MCCYYCLHRCFAYSSLIWNIYIFIIIVELFLFILLLTILPLMPKSRRQKCKGCVECISKKVKLRRLDEHDLLSLKSSLKSTVKHGDMISRKCYGDKDDPLPDPILK